MSGMNVSVAVADPNDVVAVIAIEQVAFSDPWSGRAFRDALDHPSVYFACAHDTSDDRVVGYVVAWFVVDEGEIANLAVAPAAWGNGIGRALLDAALAEGLRRSIEAMYLEVRDSNARA